MLTAAYRHQNAPLGAGNFKNIDAIGFKVPSTVRDGFERKIVTDTEFIEGFLNALNQLEPVPNKTVEEAIGGPNYVIINLHRNETIFNRSVDYPISIHRDRNVVIFNDKVYYLSDSLSDYLEKIDSVAQDGWFQ